MTPLFNKLAQSPKIYDSGREILTRVQNVHPDDICLQVYVQSVLNDGRAKPPFPVYGRQHGFLAPSQTGTVPGLVIARADPINRMFTLFASLDGLNTLDDNPHVEALVLQDDVVMLKDLLQTPYRPQSLLFDDYRLTALPRQERNFWEDERNKPFHIELSVAAPPDESPDAPHAGERRTGYVSCTLNMLRDLIHHPDRDVRIHHIAYQRPPAP